MNHSNNAISRGAASVRNMWASLMCMGMLLASGLAYSQTGFTDRVKNARTLDSATLANQTKQGVDNWGTIISLGAMLVGLFFFIWGIMWVMRASRDEGRTKAAPGWIMMIGGGALGGAMGVYLLSVGIFASAGT